MWDNDGQFLLIEAAYALPRWLKPETSEHRVWLRRGRLHVIPLPTAAAPDLPASPTPAQALAVLREGRCVGGCSWGRAGGALDMSTAETLGKHP